MFLIIKKKKSETIHCNFSDRNTDDVSNQLNMPIYTVAGYGENVGLTVLVDSEVNEYMSYTNKYYGVNVLIHAAEDFPETSISSTLVQLGQDASIAVVPSVSVSSPDIRSLPISQRKCLFKDEVY